MSKKIRLVVVALAPVLMMGAVCMGSYSAFADECENGVQTNLFGCVEDNGDGCGIYTILNLVLTVLTYGVGIAATIGIVITSIMYLTAGDDTGKTAKAKTRIFEIVIGILLYAMMWAALNWLLPGGLLNGTVCSTS